MWPHRDHIRDASRHDRRQPRPLADRHHDRAARRRLGGDGPHHPDAVGPLLPRVADEKRLPFDVKVPTAKRRAAMQQLAAGKGKRSALASALFTDLGI